MTIKECAHHQGLQYPESWLYPPTGYTTGQWKINLYEAIGNGVPVYMARAFGEMYK